MTPEDLRKMYRDEPEATDDEAREAQQEARTPRGRQSAKKARTA